MDSTYRRMMILAAIAALFLVLRLPGTGLPLHQDEYKWPLIANPATAGDMSVPHPPLGEFIYREAGKLVGYDVHFRYVPLAFGFANLLLLWYWLLMRAGERAALLGALLFSVSYFSVLASLMVDTDGQILPFFLLAALIGYERARTDMRWWGLVVAACVGGFFVKASFILAIVAIVADLLWTHRHVASPRTLARYAGYGAISLCGLAALLVFSQYLFPFFDLAGSLQYWAHFATFRHNWFQVAIQAVKAVLYLSPLLVLMPLFATRQDLEKGRPLVFFTIFGLIFYLILFDFSVGALDRYLQFLIVPLVSLAAVILARMFPSMKMVQPYAILAGSVIALGLCALQFAPQAVPALYPKSAWLGRIASLHWNFLYPFSGGSGPLTFYVSFAFLGLTWVTAVLVVGAGLLRSAWLPIAIAMLLPLSLVYNATFTEEYLVGGINGFAPGLVERAAAFIANDPNIEHVVVYNDNGGAEIQAVGKYEKRLYTTPDFGDWALKAATMNAFKGHYLIVDAPPVDPQSFFARYFATCVPVYQDVDRYMHATVLDCRQAPPAVL